MAVARAECQPRLGHRRGVPSTVPTYQYVCTNPEGKHEFEVVQSFTDPAVATCPECGAPVRKVYGSVGVVFKGSGFYRTDSRKAESSSAPAASKESSTTKESSSSSNGSKESSSSSSSTSSSTTPSTGGKAAN
nr:FmdB family zinc ribbon protein [Modestobacter versicolor]